MYISITRSVLISVIIIVTMTVVSLDSEKFVIWECTSQISLSSSEAAHTVFACWIIAPHFFRLCRSSRKNLAHVRHWFNHVCRENGCFFRKTTAIGNHHWMSWKYDWNATTNLKPPLDQVGMPRPAYDVDVARKWTQDFGFEGALAAIFTWCSRNAFPFKSRPVSIHRPMHTHTYIYVCTYMYM